MKRMNFFNFLIFASFLCLSEIFPQVPDQIQKFRAEPYGEFKYEKESILDGNLIRTLFKNTGEIGHWPFQPSGEWPKGSGHPYLDGMTILIGAEVTAPGNQAVIHPIEASYYEEMDLNPVTGEIWGLEPIPGYSNPYSTKPAMTIDKNSLPSVWPDVLGLSPEYNGKFPSYFGLNSNRAALESFFVMDDSRDGEFKRPPYNFFPILSDTNRGGLGLRIETRYLQFLDEEVQNVLFMKYKFTNISDFSYDKTCFGFLAEPGVGGTYSGGDNVWYNKDLDLTYMWDRTGKGGIDNWVTGFMGFAFLDTPNDLGITSESIYFIFTDGPYRPWPKFDETIWQIMVGGFTDTSIVNNNVWNVVLASGPFSFPRFSTDSIAAAIICAQNLDDLVFNTRIAKQFYDNNFSLTSKVESVSLTVTKPASKERVSGVLPIQCALTNYTGMATHYIYHFTPPKGWTLLGKDENNSGYFYWQTNASNDGVLNKIKIISVTDSNVLSTTSGFFTIQNNQSTKPEIIVLSPSNGETLSGNTVVNFIAGDADGNSVSVKFFTKADTNSIPSLIAANLTGKDSSFMWNSSGSANSFAGELIGQVISGTDTANYSINNLVIKNERWLPTTTDFLLDQKAIGTGNIELHSVIPSQITGDDYLMVFDTAYFEKPTLYYKLYNKSKGNTFVGDVFEVKDGFESFLFDGLRIVTNNDTGSKVIKESLTKWIAGNSNANLEILPDLSSIAWKGKADYEIRFSDHIVDTTDFKDGRYIIMPVDFEIYNITSNYKTKIAMSDPDKSGSFTPGDELRIVELEGSKIRISWRINYQTQSNIILPNAGDVFRIVAKKEFVKGDSIVFSSSGLIGIRSTEANPTSFTLSQNYPNPFNPITTIRFAVPQNEIVKIKVYDFLGVEIATLVNREMNSGSYEVDFNGKTLASGIYFVRMEAGKFVETKKIVLLK